MTASCFEMAATPEVYQRRRADFARTLKDPVVVLAGQSRARKYPTNVYPFRAASNYLYFGGPPIQGGAIIIEPGSNGNDGCALVRTVMGFDDIVWIGSAPSDDDLICASGLTTLISPDQVPGHLAGRTPAYVGPPCPPSMEWMKSLTARPLSDDEKLTIIDLRLIQDEHELKAMRRAARIGIEAKKAAASAVAAGKSEASVAAAHLAVVQAHQCEVSFNPIISIHGEVLHNEGYPGTLESGRLLLVDSGVEEPSGYTSDMTRVFPVDGKFTSIQRHLYDTVLRAECEGVAACTPGTRFRDIHDLAGRIICEGLVQAELLRGDPAELAGRAVHTLFFPHGLGHLIGLDVHDMEDFGDLAGYAKGRTRRTEFGSKFLRLDRDLAPGMSVTIEPGIYIVPAIWQNDDFLAPFADAVNRPAINELVESQFGGIRIEDTVHVTAGDSGPENLTKDLPKTADEVEAMIG